MSNFFLSFVAQSSIIGLLFPQTEPIARYTVSPEQQQKYDKLRAILNEVGEKVGVSAATSLDFRIIKKESVAELVSCFPSLQKPIIDLNDLFFIQFEHPLILNHPDYQDWIQTLEALPDHPLALSEAIEKMTPEEREKIHKQSANFIAVMTAEEWKGIAAHELGHGRQSHSWKKMRIFLH